MPYLHVTKPLLQSLPAFVFNLRVLGTVSVLQEDQCINYLLSHQSCANTMPKFSVLFPLSFHLFILLKYLIYFQQLALTQSNESLQKLRSS